MIYPTRRFYLVATSVILLFCGGYLLGSLLLLAQLALAVLLLAFIIDSVWLLRINGLLATRQCADRFSNGDDNPVRLTLTSRYPFLIRLTVIDEIPIRFQDRDIAFTLSLRPGEEKRIDYKLHPTERGTYGFGHIRAFAGSRLGLVERRFTLAQPQDVRVYPSYLQLQRYELLAMSHRLTERGIKKLRRPGHQTEFEQIREYVSGDDYRTINWKASARRHNLMVNQYQDERSQPIYSLVDKGRVMQQSFRGMTLLDYAINASLVLSYVAIHKDDRAGLVTFNDHFSTFVPASRQSGQMQLLLESLYAEQTSFGETDFSALCIHLRKLVSKRSLLVLYTNFSTLTEMQRQLPYLQQLARQHRLLVVFFEDAQLHDYILTPAPDAEGYYRRVIAEKFAFEQRLIVSTLQQRGILSLLTTPEALTVDVINKYLEMKARQLI